MHDRRSGARWQRHRSAEIGSATRGRRCRLRDTPIRAFSATTRRALLDHSHTSSLRPRLASHRGAGMRRRAGSRRACTRAAAETRPGDGASYPRARRDRELAGWRTRPRDERVCRRSPGYLPAPRPAALALPGPSRDCTSRVSRVRGRDTGDLHLASGCRRGAWRSALTGTPSQAPSGACRAWRREPSHSLAN
jgi:hypothetical protein